MVLVPVVPTSISFDEAEPLLPVVMTTSAPLTSFRIVEQAESEYAVNVTPEIPAPALFFFDRVNLASFQSSVHVDSAV